MRSLLVALMLLTAIPSMTWAQPRSSTVETEAETLAQQAKVRFKAGDFEGAAKLFMQAYAKSHAPALVFNAARAHEEAGKKGDAAALFRLYISLANDTEGMLDARRRLAKMEPMVIQPAKTVDLPQPVTLTVTRPVPPNQDSHLGAWLTTGGAIVAVVSGVSLMVIGKSDSQQANTDFRASHDRNAYDRAYNTSNAEWTLGAVLTGTGAVLCGVSIYLWNKAPVKAQPTHNGIALGGSF